MLQISQQRLRIKNYRDMVFGVAFTLLNIAAVLAACYLAAWLIVLIIE